MTPIDLDQAAQLHVEHRRAPPAPAEVPDSRPPIVITEDELGPDLPDILKRSA